MPPILTHITSFSTAATVASLCVMMLTTLHYRNSKRRGGKQTTVVSGDENDGDDADLRAQERASNPTFYCGTRHSRLAMIQTRFVVRRMRERNGKVMTFRIREGVSSMGDQILNVSLKDLAGKTPGVFTKELEDGLFLKLYDFVVHSLKDVPTTLPAGLAIAAITKREDPRDVVVFPMKDDGKTRSTKYERLRDLPVNSVIGTSSVRREALLKSMFPHLQIKLIRGNLQTRMRKLDDFEYDAIILAAAGLKRLGMEHRIGEYLDPRVFPYGVSQGALGIECRENDYELVSVLRETLQDEETAARCLAERCLLRELQGGCQVPLGVQSEVTLDKRLTLDCSVLSLSGNLRIDVLGSSTRDIGRAEALGRGVADVVKQLGGVFLPEELKAARNISKATKLGESSSTTTTTTQPRLNYGSMENPNR